MSTARLRGVIAGAVLLLCPLIGHAEPTEELIALTKKVNIYSREQRLLHARLAFDGLAQIDLGTLHSTDARLHAGGRPLTLVHLWSVKCAPCINELPALRQIMAHLRKESGSSLRTVFIAEDLPEPLTGFLRAHAAALPEVEHWMSSPSSNLRIELHDVSQPLTLLLDEKFVVRHAFVGPLTERRNELYSTVSRLLHSLCSHPAKS